MLHLTRSSLEGSVNEEDSKRLTKYENVTDNIAHELMLYLGSIEEEGLTSNQVERASRYRFFYQLLESIADHCNAIHCLSEKKEVQFEEPVKTLFLSRFEYLTGLFEESFVDWSSSRPESINLEGLRVEDIEVLRSSQEEVRQVSLHFIYLEYDIIRLVKATAS